MPNCSRTVRVLFAVRHEGGGASRQYASHSAARVATSARAQDGSATTTGYGHPDSINGPERFLQETPERFLREARTACNTGVAECVAGYVRRSSGRRTRTPCATQAPPRHAPPLFTFFTFFRFFTFFALSGKQAADAAPRQAVRLLSADAHTASAHVQPMLSSVAASHSPL